MDALFTVCLEMLSNLLLSCHRYQLLFFLYLTHVVLYHINRRGDCGLILASKTHSYGVQTRKNIVVDQASV